MQIGEIGIRASRAVERFHIGFQLDQISRYETCSEADVAHDLRQQPRAVATGTRGFGERLFRCLDARLHADQIADVALDHSVEIADEVDRRLLFGAHLAKVTLQIRTCGVRHQIGRQLLLQVIGVGEGPVLGAFLDEEVERVDDRHVGDEIDRDGKFRRLLRHHDTRQEIAERILLPVEKMRLGRDVQRIAENRRPAVGSRPEPDDLWPHVDTSIVAVAGLMGQRDVEDHGSGIIPV